MYATLRQRLSAACSVAFERAGLDRRFGEVIPCAEPSMGDFQCNGAMAAAKAAKRNPRDIAEEIAAALRPLKGQVASCEIAGPGFINIRVTQEALIADLADPAGVPWAGDAERGAVFIDYGGPNIAKAMHVGHLRSSIIGESLKRIFRARGHRVVGDVHLGDWGLPMGLLAAELKIARPELAYFGDGDGPFPSESPVSIDDLEEMYPRASARSKEDDGFKERARAMTAAIQSGHPGLRALWQHFRDVSVARLKEDFASLGVTFDCWDGESTFADGVDGMCEHIREIGAAVESDGALVIPVARDGDKTDMPPFILRKSDGASLYSTTDLITLVAREMAGARRVVYVVDARQGLHFQQLFRASEAIGIDGIHLDHAGFGTVNGPDGKPFKTREGGVMKLSDLVSMARAKAMARLVEGGMAEGAGEEETGRIAHAIGVGAVKFADLSTHRETSYVFDLDRFVSFEGRTGPYVQYMAVRLGSIMEKAAAEGRLPGELGAPSNEAERNLMVVLSGYGDALINAERILAPSEVAKWVFDVAQAVGRFYVASPILSEKDADLAGRRLALVSVARDRIVSGLGLLGIDVPERM